mgnify:CR=1 FL=1
MNDLKNISIRQFLARRGILPKYERNGYGMYLSPLREERTPSFKVDYVQNLWYDFGLGEGGTLLTLVMHRPICRRGILPRDPLRGKRPRLFRRRFPQRCRRVGTALRTVQRRLLAQTHHHLR